MSWNDLSMADRAAYIKIGLDNGITNPEEEANRLGYYPDERGHRDDRVKKPAHPTHPSRGKWNSFTEFELTKVKRAGNFIWRYYGKGI